MENTNYIKCLNPIKSEIIRKRSIEIRNFLITHGWHKNVFECASILGLLVHLNLVDPSNPLKDQLSDAEVRTAIYMQVYNIDASLRHFRKALMRIKILRMAACKTGELEAMQEYFRDQFLNQN